MKFTCEKTALVEALSVVGRALPARSTMPALEGVFIEATMDTVHLMTTDTRLGMEMSFPAQVEEDGVAVLPGKLLIDVARRLPDGQVSLDVEDTQAHIRALRSHTTLQTMSVDSYPQLPEDEQTSGVLLYMDQEDLRTLIRQTAYAASVDESRPILTGVYIEVEPLTIRFVALDGFRLAMREYGLSDPVTPIQVVCPARTLSEIGAVMGKNDEKVRLHLSQTHLSVEAGNIRIVTRLMEGEYIRYRQILPGEWQSRARVQVKAMLQAIERAGTMAREGRNNLIRFNIENQEMVLSADSELGCSEERIPVTLEGEGIQIAFNARYLMDTLKNIDDDEIDLCFTTNISPCVIRPVEGDSYLCLVLPVRVYA